MGKPCLRFHRIQIQRRIEADDGAGGQTTSEWVDHMSASATVDPKQGRERERGGAIENPVIFEIRLRYRSGITGAMRILFKGRILNIRSVLNEAEANRWLKIRAEEDVEQVA